MDVINTDGLVLVGTGSEWFWTMPQLEAMRTVIVSSPASTDPARAGG